MNYKALDVGGGGNTSSAIKSSRLNSKNNAGGNGEETDFLTTTVNITKFEPHPKKKCLILCGDIHVTVTNPLCYPVLVAEENEDFRKLVHLDGLSKTSDTEQIVDFVLQKCSFLNGSEHRDHLAVVIDFLKNRQYDDNGIVVAAEVGGSTTTTPTTPTPGLFGPDFQVEVDELTDLLESEEMKEVDITQLDTYVELLYEEDFSLKSKGARCIARLAKCTENLGIMIHHETVLNALFRTLREDYRKSMELSTHIMSICLHYSKYSDFHPILLSNKITSVAFDMVEFELGRWEKWRLELARRQDIVENRAEFPGSAGSYQKARGDFEKMRVKFGELTQKQGILLALCFDTLFLLSDEDPSRLPLAKEMIARGLVLYLVEVLERRSVELLKVALKYLTSLALFSQCKTQMGQLYIVEKLMQLLDSNIPLDVVKGCLGLLFNLCFDTKLRHKMVLLGLLPKLAQFLRKEDSTLEVTTSRLLYVMSMDKKARQRLTPIAPQIIPSLIDTLLFRDPKAVSVTEGPTTTFSSDDDTLQVVVASLLVNLATVKKTAVLLCDPKGTPNGGLLPFLQHAFSTEDEVVMKIVKNLSAHSQCMEFFAPFIPDLARAIQDASSTNFMLEVVGTLGNLDLPNIDYCKLLEEFDLISWIKRVFNDYLSKPQESDVAGDKDNSLLLTTVLVVVLTGTCCSDPECSDLLIQSGIFDQLVKILIVTNSPELKSQVLYVFYRICLSHPDCRKKVQEDSQLPQIILELIMQGGDSDGQDVQELCEAIMTLFGECDPVWMERLKEKRFKVFNEAWLEMVEKSSSFGFGGDVVARPKSSIARPKSKMVIAVPTRRTGSEEEDQNEEEEEEEKDAESDTLLTDEEEEEDEESLLGAGRVTSSTKKKGPGGGGDIFFDKFRAQYEHEMKRVKEHNRLDKEEQDLDLSNDDDYDDGEGGGNDEFDEDLEEEEDKGSQSSGSRRQ